MNGSASQPDRQFTNEEKVADWMAAKIREECRRHDEEFEDYMISRLGKSSIRRGFLEGLVFMQSVAIASFFLGLHDDPLGPLLYVIVVVVGYAGVVALPTPKILRRNG